MRYYWELIRHFLTANSRHGTHSPFVYALAEKVVYAKAGTTTSPNVIPANLSFRYRCLLHDLLSALDVGQMDIYPHSLHGQAVWVDLNMVSREDLIPLLSKGTAVIVHEPYQSKSKWQDLIADPAVVVSIDLFHFGILLHRTEQRKENFRLRYPYWR